MGIFAVDFASYFVQNFPVSASIGVTFKYITVVSEVESIGCIIINLSKFQERGCCLNLPRQVFCDTKFSKNCRQNELENVGGTHSLITSSFAIANVPHT